MSDQKTLLAILRDLNDAALGFNAALEIAARRTRRLFAKRP